MGHISAYGYITSTIQHRFPDNTTFTVYMTAYEWPSEVLHFWQKFKPLAVSAFWFMHKHIVVDWNVLYFLHYGYYKSLKQKRWPSNSLKVIWQWTHDLHSFPVTCILHLTFLSNESNWPIIMAVKLALPAMGHGEKNWSHLARELTALITK